MPIKVVAISKSGRILATDEGQHHFFVLESNHGGSVNLGDILYGEFHGEGNLLNKIRNESKHQSIWTSLERWNLPLTDAIDEFLLPVPPGVIILAGVKSFVSDADDIASDLEREIAGPDWRGD